ncbi:MAG: hypothetical protein U0T56_03365 [Ferruginibacter sp.]
MEAANALKGRNTGIISDGGIRYTGDMVVRPWQPVPIAS